MALAPSPLTSLSEVQRAQAQECFTIIRPALEKEIMQFDLIYRREATRAKVMWQADHSPLGIWLLNEEGKPAWKGNHS